MSSLSLSGKNWVLKKFNEEDIFFLKENFSLDEITSKLLSIRKIKKDEINSFLNPSIKNFLPNPDVLIDMEKSSKRTVEAIFKKEKIGIFGDYDVDGTTSVSMMYLFLKSQNANCDYYIPDRESEGYGISYKGIDDAIDKGISLMICLDCGIKAVEKVVYAKSKGLDLIICDHHRPGEHLPDAIAVLDPKRVDCTYPFKELCGCGVGFKLIQA